MGTTINYASTPYCGSALLQVGDSSRAAPVNTKTVVNNANGAQIERVTLTAIATAVASIVRLYRNDGAGNRHLINETLIPATTVSATVPAQPITLEAVDNPNLFPILIPSGWTLDASINDTQIAGEMKVDSVAQSQTTGGAAALNLNGTNVTAASTTAVAAAAAPTANVPMTLTATPYVATVPALLSITSAANVSAVSYKIIGRKADGTLITETIVGPNNTTVYSVNVYKAVLAVIPNATNASTASVGYSTVAGTSVLTVPSPIIFTSGGNLSAVNFTITGTDSSGILQSEVLAGPNASYVQSTKTYASILQIAASGAVGTNVTVGNPPILGGIRIQAEGGGF